MKLKKALFPKRKKKESFFKYLTRMLHLWMGLFSSVVVLIVCITGCIYVFKNQISDLYNRDKIYVSVGQERFTTDEFQKILEADNQNIKSIIIPSSPKRSQIISYADRDTKIISTHYFNPYTGENLGGGSTELDGFFATVEDLHKNLLMGDIGKQIVGAFVLIFILMLITGLVLWWPKRKKRQIKRAFTVKFNGSFYRMNHDLHNALGFYSMLILLFIAITGVYITYPWVKSGVLMSLGGQAVTEQQLIADDNISDSFADLMDEMLKKEGEKSELKEIKPIAPDSIILLTNQHLAYQGNTVLSFPDDENPRYKVQKTNTQHFFGIMAADLLEFDKKGELQKKELFKDKPLHQQFKEISKQLHTGEFMGLPSLIVYFLATLVGVLLPITGFIIWWKKV